MKYWKDLNIGAKYGAAFGVTIGLFIIGMVIVYFQMNSAGKSVEDLEDRSMIALEMAELTSIARTKDIRIADYIREPLGAYVNEYEDHMARFNELQQKYSERFTGTSLEDSMALIAQKDKEINQLFLQEMVGSLGNTRKVEELRTETQNLRTDLIKELVQIQTQVEEAMEESTSVAKSGMKMTIYVLLGVVLLSLLTGSTLMWFIHRQIRRRMDRLVEAADQISRGELYHMLEENTSRDEIGLLNNSILQMKGNLQELLEDVSALSVHVSDQSKSLQWSTQEVQEASRQIAATMQELSSGSEQQAGDAATLSELMEQLLSKIQESNDIGRQVAHQSDEVLKQSNQGHSLMNESRAHMSEIHEVMQTAVQKVQRLDHQSSEISKLIQVIQSIAEQTNLLALNAAIEAARAGEHGKGFAVVADEVRKLAEQVSNSVGEITEMVATIQTESKNVSQSLENGYEKVESGTTQIQQTGRTFDGIQQSIVAMSTGIQRISSHLQEVSESTGVMNQSIESVASHSQQSASGVEQTSASIQQTSSSMDELSSRSNELAAMAEQLNESLRRFQLANQSEELRDEDEEEEEVMTA